MRWSFDLTCRDADATAKVNFQERAGEILIHVDYRPFRGGLILNRLTGGEWQEEKLLWTPKEGNPADTINVTVETFESGRIVLRHPGGTENVDWTDAHTLGTCRIWLEGTVVRGAEAAEDSAELRGWRLYEKPSGFPCGNAKLRAKSEPGVLEPGLSFIIRARNEARTVEACIRSIAGLGDEIVFVDNASEDGTGLIAEKLKSGIFELKTFSYPHRLPKVGAAHAREVLSGGSNTLGHFYNWCLAQSGRMNFVKWDADYIAIRQNLAEMIGLYSLRTRADNFALWFSGLEVYTDGSRLWVDRESRHAEFRAFSLQHGTQWVNLPPWEEIDQRSLYRAQKLFYRKPVYLEIFRLDGTEFDDRGLFTEDRRDAERQEIVATFRKSGRLPERFREIASLTDAGLAETPLSAQEIELSHHFDKRFRARPKIHARKTKTLHPAEAVPQNEYAVFILSCQKNADRQRVIRESWGHDLDRLGIPHYFIIGRPAQPTQLIGDVLYVNCPDSYEFLASKVLAAIEYSMSVMNVDYFMKIDDDCVFDPYRFQAAEYSKYDYVGGGFAGGDNAGIDWHLGKCHNEQLDLVPYFREPGFNWVGGQYGYMLSRKARYLLVKQADRMRSSLYEDYIVARILAERGIEPVFSFGSQRSALYSDQWDEMSNVCLISDVPSAAKMREVYRKFVGEDAGDRWAWEFTGSHEAIWDWMDIEAVRQKLGV